MGVSKSYNRSKATIVLATPMVFSLAMAEKPGVPVVHQAVEGDVVAADIAAAAGNTGNLKAEISVDVNEGVTTTNKKLFRVETALTLGTDAGAIPVLVTTVTPINPDGTDNTAGVQVITMAHPLSMDAFQTAAGRVRQDA